LPPFGDEQRLHRINTLALSACASFFRDILRTSVIEFFVENILENAPMIRDLEAVEQLLTPQVQDFCKSISGLIRKLRHNLYETEKDRFAGFHSKTKAPAQ